MLGGSEDNRFPSLLSPTSVETAEALEEIIRDIWEATPAFPENRFFAAGGRAGIPPVTDFPVAAANTAEAVTGLFWLDVAKMFLPLGVPDEATWARPTPPDATTEDMVGAEDPMGMMLAATGIDTDAAGADGTEEMVLLVVAVLCFGSICRMSTSGSLIRVAISVWACLVASSEPLIVMDRSPCTLPCFSTSMWAPVAARIALMLLPARPMTREMACTGTCTFLHSITEADWLC